jgi:hypothetical protein
MLKNTHLHPHATKGGAALCRVIYIRIIFLISTDFLTIIVPSHFSSQLSAKSPDRNVTERTRAWTTLCRPPYGTQFPLRMLHFPANIRICTKATLLDVVLNGREIRRLLNVKEEIQTEDIRKLVAENEECHLLGC